MSYEDDLRRLHERMDTLTRELIESNRIQGERLTILETQRMECMKQCQRLASVVFGNGSKGLDEQVRHLTSLEDDRSKWSCTLWNMIPSITTGVVVGLVILIVQIVLK